MPESSNIAQAVCGRHTDGATRLALIEIRNGGSHNTCTFGALDYLSDKFANVLVSAGVRAGDKVAVALPQSAALPISHLGALKIGAVVVPLGPSSSDADLELRLRGSGARAMVSENSTVAELEPGIRQGLPELQTIIIANDDTAGPDLKDCGCQILDFWSEVSSASSEFMTSEKTDSSTPAFIFYSSGAAEGSRGVVVCHGSLLRHVANLEMFDEMNPGDENAVFWSAADWASVGPLDFLYSAWYYGRPVVTSGPSTFSPAQAFSLLEQYGITNAFIPGAELGMMSRAEPNPQLRYTLKLRNISSGPEPVASQAQTWGQQTLGASIKEAKELTTSHINLDQDMQVPSRRD
jgi:acetyl-CoA synthetase